MNRAPAFQFFPKDWLDFKVQRMSLAAQGAYMKLLCFMWKDSKDQSSILDNNDLLARAIGSTVEQWLELRQEIQQSCEPILEEKDGRLLSARLKEEAAMQRKYRKQQSEKGKRSVQQRLNRSSTTVEPMYQPEGNSSSSSSSSVLKKKDKSAHPASPVYPNGSQDGFQIFWTAFPRKRNKGKAEEAWLKLKPDESLLGRMLSKIDQATHTPDWKKENGKYIPYPASWLNAKGWEDEYAVSPQRTGGLVL
jgi:uncharacterized protein YdaU (DUF1376 family)